LGFRIVIPARYASVRLPGKALCEVAGRPLLAHVHDRAMESGADEVVIATDDARIERAASAFGARVMTTSASHASGTERIAEVASRLGWPGDTLVVNLQGDEPLVPGAAIRQVAELLEAAPQAALATLCAPIATLEEFLDPNVVKVVTDSGGRALCFSRAPLPWPRDEVDGSGRPRAWAHARRHIGLYAYRVAALVRLAALAECPPERIERLEQLRALWHGLEIRVAPAVEIPAPGVDTAQDLGRVRGLLERKARG
jgi:3-deoxy-manno-octulosonate cytidylyltransferase (CMP-KDO synthetase)